MQSNIFIPKKCKVGFQKRNDTYTQKLGYVIYNDGKVWRKEKSWLTWCIKFVDKNEYERFKRPEYDMMVKNIKDYFNALKNGAKDYYNNYVRGMTEEQYIKLRIGNYEDYTPRHNITIDSNFAPIEFDNVPISGFVLNKKVGGNTGGWNPRQTYTRVYDPRGFEFEISIQNLLYILENTSSIKGKGLEGNFIYGWQGTELMLIPESAPEFKSIIQFTNLMNLKPLKLSTLVAGNKYQFSDNKIKTYLGKHKTYDRNGVLVNEVHAFFENYNYPIFTVQSTTQIRLNLGIDSDYANKYTSFQKDKKFFPKNQNKLETVSNTERLDKDYHYYIKLKNKYYQVGIQENFFTGNLSYCANTPKRVVENFRSFKEIADKHKLLKIRKI